MEAIQASNDVRGWIMCIVSGIACVVGASIICVDSLVRYFPGKKDFRIEDSSVFLACSLSLSFGVMLFSALVSMLPSSKSYLNKAGFSAPVAEWIRLGCFIAGFVGIQVVSRILHRFIPSHVVDCDHTHEGTPPEGNSNHKSRTHSHDINDQSPRQFRNVKSRADGSSKMAESTPLLNGENGRTKGKGSPESTRQTSLRGDVPLDHRHHGSANSRRPSMMEVQSRVMSFVRDTKDNCDQNGPCYGYSDPCGRECFKSIRPKSLLGSRKPTLIRTLTGTRDVSGVLEIPEGNIEVGEMDLNEPTISSQTSRAHSQDAGDQACESDEDGDLEAQHHHHVPTNAFMSIGLQTSVAIALHRLPEGFFTFATNHANPTLGFTVFIALLMHSIIEGFSLSIMSFLSSGSRIKALLWSSAIGGFSQPIGAGIAAIWFKVAKHTSRTPGFAIYGCMFAVTAGIMASVALSLFVESLSINHNSQLCVASALVGMIILGISTALTA